MYQVIIKGRDLEELKEAVADINHELNAGNLSGSVEKNIESNIGAMEVGPRLAESPINTPIVKANVVTSTQQAGRMTPQTPIAPVAIQPVTIPDNLVGMTPTNTVTIHDANVELDTEGLPWDKRINPASRGKLKATGAWKRKKNLEDNFVETIKNELRSSVNQVAPVVPSLPATNPVVVPTPLEVAPVQTLTPPDAVLSTPITETPIPQPMASNGHTIETFKLNYPMIVSSLINEGKLTQDYVNSLKAYFQVEEIWDISDAQKVEMFNNFTASGFIQKVG